MKTMTVKAYAKINLYLDVTGKLDNGYHTVETVMQAISLCDTVTVTLEKGALTHTTLTCSDKRLPCDESNLAYRAAMLFQKHHNVDACISIHIEKNIPIAGGLAGGSTDAAAVLCALDALYGSPYSTEALCQLSAPLGADVPFCVAANSGIPLAYGTHYGEVITPLSGMPMAHIVVAAANEGVSTPWAYNEIDKLPLDPQAHTPNSMLAALKEQAPLSTVLSLLYNRFEAAIIPKHAEARQNKALLLESGAMAAMMSGSGPTVIGFFDTEEGAMHAQKLLTQNGIRAWCASTLS